MTLHEVSMMDRKKEECLAAFSFKSFEEAVQFIKLASENDVTGLSFDYQRSEV